LHVGSGKSFLPGWLNADLFTGDIYLDARKPFPFKDNTLNYIFCEHLLCQLSVHDGFNFLKECHRSLKQKGILRITMPDLQKIISLYTDKINREKPMIEQYLRKIGMPSYASCEFLNSFFYSFGHKFIYDQEFITSNLMQIGFESTTICENQRSEHKQLAGIEKHGDFQNTIEALTIEATK
jgi:predicted SAM-dependent methyltransferase